MRVLNPSRSSLWQVEWAHFRSSSEAGWADELSNSGLKRYHSLCDVNPTRGVAELVHGSRIVGPAWRTAARRDAEVALVRHVYRQDDSTYLYVAICNVEASFVREADLRQIRQFVELCAHEGHPVLHRSHVEHTPRCAPTDRSRGLHDILQSVVELPIRNNGHVSWCSLHT